MPRKYKSNRDDEMIGDAVGELQGKVEKGTLTRKNCGNQYYGNLSEPKLPAALKNQWYIKKDVTGMPSYKNQSGRGTPRVLLLVDGNSPTEKAWFSPHYKSFEELEAEFIQRGASWKAYYSK